MTFDGSRVLAVVPARGGSKGIPGKNLKRLAGKTLIAHAAKVISGLDFVDLAVLTTEDEEIAREGRACGLHVIDRPPELATDEAQGVDTWRHAWVAAEETTGSPFDLSVLLQPTSPLRTVEDVVRCVREVTERGYDAAITVSPVPSHYVPEKLLRRTPDSSVVPYLESGFQWRRQDAGVYYFLNGYAYVAKRSRVVEDGLILGPRTGAVVISREVVNIDEPIDLEMATWLQSRQEPGRDE